MVQSHPPKIPGAYQDYVVFTLASWVRALRVRHGYLPAHDRGPDYHPRRLYNYWRAGIVHARQPGADTTAQPRPELYRPFRSPLSIHVPWKGGKYEVAIMPLLGFFVCLGVWILVLSLHEIGKIVGTSGSSPA